MGAEKQIQELLEDAAKAAEELLMKVQTALIMADANDIDAELANATPGQPFGASDWTPEEWQGRLWLVREFMKWAQTPLDPNDSKSAPIKLFFRR